jgi:hypothetical protein
MEQARCINNKKRYATSVLKLLAAGVSKEIISSSLACYPEFVSKLNASTTVDEVYDFFMRAKFSYSAYLLDSGASIDKAAEITGIYKALLEKLQTNRACCLNDEGFVLCKEIAWHMLISDFTKAKRFCESREFRHAASGFVKHNCFK